MSVENVKLFYEKLANDESFRIQIQNVQSKKECSQLVKAAGYDFTQEELEEYTNQLLELSFANSELKDLEEKELEAVFGGIYGLFINKPYPPMQAMYGVPRVLWDV